MCTFRRFESFTKHLEESPRIFPLKSTPPYCKFHRLLWDENDHKCLWTLAPVSHLKIPQPTEAQFDTAVVLEYMTSYLFGKFSCWLFTIEEENSCWVQCIWFLFMTFKGREQKRNTFILSCLAHLIWFLTCNEKGIKPENLVLENIKHLLWKLQHLTRRLNSNPATPPPTTQKPYNCHISAIPNLPMIMWWLNSTAMRWNHQQSSWMNNSKYMSNSSKLVLDWTISKDSYVLCIRCT
jgi:hypothetical protein